MKTLAGALQEIPFQQQTQEPMLGFQLIFAFGISLIAFLNTHPSANS
jgi:hypothetical protein